MSSEPKRIGKSIFDFLLHRLFTIIQIAFFVRYFIAYRRMDIAFFQLLDEHFDIQEFIPLVFTNAFYQQLGRKRAYPLTGFLSALILQKIFSIPSDSLLILFLSLCKELRDFCGFSKVPDAPLFTRFQQNFEPFI